MRVFIITLCFFVMANVTAFANIWDEQGINFYPIPAQYQHLYDRIAYETRNLKYGKPPYGQEVFFTFDLANVDLYHYTICHMNNATYYIGARFSYCNQMNDYGWRGYKEDAYGILYYDNADITQRKFKLIGRGNNSVKIVPNQLDNGTHEEDVWFTYEYTNTPKTQMSEDEKFHRALAEAVFMHRFHREFFGQKWLCADNNPEYMKIFTSANVAEEQF